MKIGNWNRAFALAAAYADGSLQCGEGNTHVRGMSGNAFFAGSENGVCAIESFKSSASASRSTFVALRKTRVHKVRAARALEQIAAVSSKVAKLGRRARENRTRQQGIILPDKRVVGSIAVARQCAQTQAAIRDPLDAGKRKPVDVQQTIRSFDSILHQVDEISSPCKK